MLVSGWKPTVWTYYHKSEKVSNPWKDFDNYQRRQTGYDFDEKREISSDIVCPDWLETMEEASVEVFHLETFFTLSESIRVNDVFRGSFVGDVHGYRCSHASPSVHPTEEVE
jgi:hypothetical protein